MATLIGFLVLAGIVIALLVATRSPGRPVTRRRSGPDAHWLWWTDGGDRHDAGGGWFGGGGDFGGGGGDGGGGGS
jgi:uncharacterized protein